MPLENQWWPRIEMKCPIDDDDAKEQAVSQAPSVSQVCLSMDCFVARRHRQMLCRLVYIESF
jgi:hypothetical protein